MLNLYVSRAKIFMHNEGVKELRCTLSLQKGPQPAPDWVREAPGFKEGIADGSIIDLTPLEAPKKSKKHVEEPEEAKATEEAKAPEETKAPEEVKAPKSHKRPKGHVTASVVHSK